MADVWRGVLDRALTRHDASLRQLKQRADWVYQNLETWKNELGEPDDEIGAEIERSNKKMSEVISWMNDPVVYVRNYAETSVAVYHASLDCGWVNPQRVRKMLLGEAEVAGLHPCSSCGYRAVQREPPDIAA
jgi:uncharacterized protein YfaS (alpha-2-macroglobulin family)